MVYGQVVPYRRNRYGQYARFAGKVVKYAWRNRKAISRSAKRVFRRGSRGVVDRSNSRMMKKLDMGGQKRRSISQGGSLTKKVRINDVGTYQQSRRFNYRVGRRATKLNRALKLVQAQTQKMLLRYANISDEADPFGSTFIRNAVLTSDNTQRRYPIHCYNLFSNNQSGPSTAPDFFSAVPGFELRGDAATGSLYWSPIIAKAIDGTTDSLIWSRIQAPQLDFQPGRFSLIDWSRIRLHMYGKTRQPSFVKISLVRFDQEEFAPDFELNTSTGVSPSLPAEPYDFWASRLKPLVSSQIASKPQAVYKRQIKVLKEYFVNIQPIDAGAETASSDPRGHIKIMDIFNRWNRVIDYQLPGVTAGTNVQTDAQLADPDYMNTVNLGYSGYLRDKAKAVWLMIESVSPTQLASGTDGATSAQTQVSYDFNIEVKHSVLGPGQV